MWTRRAKPERPSIQSLGIMEYIDEVIKQLVDGKADYSYFRSSLAPETELFEFYNALALRIAGLFMNDSMSFEAADAAMNHLNTIWLDDAIKTDFPEPAYSVCLAFDAGEYSLDDNDPVELYTRPELRRLLNDA